MTDYTTIRVTKDAMDKAKDAKHDNETWNEYIQRCTEQPPKIQEFVDADESELANAVAAQLQLDLAQLSERTADEVERRLRG